MTELEINRVRELRKNPNRSGKKVWLFRLIAVGGTLSLGATLSVDEVYAQSCRTGINIIRAPQGVETLLIGKDPRTGREIVRLNYPADRLKEGSPVDSTTGRYELEVTLSTATGSKRYSAPCGQAVNIPLESAPAQPSTKPIEPTRPAQSGVRFPWEIAALSALAGLVIGGVSGGVAMSERERGARRAAENEAEQARNERDQTLGQLVTHADEVVNLQNRETQLTDALTAAGVPVPTP